MLSLENGATVLVVAAGRWAKLGPLHGLAYAYADARYVDYLATMGAMA